MVKTPGEIKDLLGHRVRVVIDHGSHPDAKVKAVIVVGVFLGFANSGEFEILMDDGFVHYCWPMLTIENE